MINYSFFVAYIIRNQSGANRTLQGRRKKHKGANQVVSTGENLLSSIWCFMAKSIIEPVNGRKQMNPENSGCALPLPNDYWETILWSKVILKVNKLQRRIAKAVKEKYWSKAKALIHLLSKSFYAKLLAVYHAKVKACANPFLPEYDRYFYKRTKWRKDLVKDCKQITTFMGNKNSDKSRVTPRRDGLKSA